VAAETDRDVVVVGEEGDALARGGALQAQERRVGALGRTVYLQAVEFRPDGGTVLSNPLGERVR
jgi:hypothetical protein